MATTTKFWTWTQVYAKMTAELDLEGGDDDFVDESEMMAYANDAIDEAEALIHTLYEDYFLTRGTITLVSGTDSYSLTSNLTSLYGHKIRAVIYFNGNEVYEVPRIRDWKKFLAYRLGRVNNTSATDLSYFLSNTTPGAPDLVFTPVPAVSGAYIEVWYLRQANRLAAGSDVVDIPEFVAFIFDYIRERVAYKEGAGSPRHQSAKADLEKTRQIMTDTLTQMVADGDNLVEPDLSTYESHN